MPATTPAQQRLFGQAYAIKTGKMKPEDLNPEYKDEIVKLADSMTVKQLKDFAETKYSEMEEEEEETKRVYEMKNIPTFESFINESIELNEAGDLAYWKQYEGGPGMISGEESWGRDVAKTSIEVDELFDTVANWWEEEGGLEIHQTKQGEKIRNLAHDYFKKFRKINGRIIDAMISQEAV